MQNASVEAQNMAASANGMVVNLEQIPKVSKAGQVALKGLAMAGNMLLMWGISEAISAIATAIDNEANRVEYAQERLQEFNSTVSESKNKLEEQQKWIEENGSKYEELARGVDNYGHNVSLTADEFSKYQSITKDIADMFPNMISGYNDQNDAIIKTKGNVDALTESYKENVRQAYASTLAKSSETYNDYKDAISLIKNQKKYLTELISGKVQLKNIGAIESKFVNDGENGFQKEMVDGKYTNVITGIDTDILSEEIIEEIKKETDGIVKTFDQLSPQLQQKIRAVLTTANSTITTETSKVKPVLEAFIYGEDGSSSGYGQLSEDGKQAIRNVISSLDDTFYSQFNSDTEMASYFQSYFIEPLKDGLDDTDLAVKINTLFSVDKNKYSSYKEYVEDILNKINQLKAYTDKDGNPIYSNEQLEGLKRIFGVSDISSTGEVSGINLVNQTKEKYRNLKGADKYIDTLQEDEIRVLYRLEPDKAKSLDALKQAVSDIGKETEKEANKTDNLSGKSFKQIWNSLGTGTDETSKKVAEEKENLLKLAEAGQLTEEAFKDSSIADTFTKAGYSISEATKKVNGFIENVKQLNSMKTGISAIISAYDEKKDAKDKRVGTDTLESMYGTLGIEDWNKPDLKVWEQYKEVASSSKSTLKELKSAQDDLATSFVNSNNFLSNITENTKDYYISLLKEMGVTNAEEVANKSLNNKLKTVKETKEKLGVSSKELKSANLEEADSLDKLVGESEAAAKALYDYMIQKIQCGDVKLDTATECQNLYDLAVKAGIATTKLRELLNAQIAFNTYERVSSNVKGLQDVINSTDDENKSLTYTTADGDVKEYKNKQSARNQLEGWNTVAKNAKKRAEEQIKKYNKKNKLKLGVEVETKPGSNKNKDKGSSSKDKSKSTQVIDWLERRLTRMQSIIDLTVSKLQNLFSVKAKNNNLDKQIKQTTKLMNQYKIAADRYMKKANSIAKASKNEDGKKVPALSKDIINKVQSGKITKASYSKLIKKYGQDYADKINSYIDYYDKAQEAKKNKQDQIAKRRELKKEQQQNKVDYADSKIDLLEQRKEYATNAKDKIEYLNQEKQYYNDSYNAQIKIAKLDGNKVEAQRLQVELEQKLRDLQKEQLEITEEQQQSELDLIQAQKERAKDYGSKNSYIEAEIAKTNELYSTQIAIANLDGKSEEAQKLQIERERQLIALQKEKFDNIANQYENQRKLLENSYQNLSNASDELEARGMIVGASLYSSQIELNNVKKAGYEEELRLLESQLPQIEQGTDEWYDALDAIQSCKDGISDTTKNTLELNKAIRDIPFLLNEKISSRFQLIFSEFELLQKLMSNKKLVNDGTFTDEGTATLASYYAQLLLTQKETKNTKVALDEMLAAIEHGDEGYEDKEQAMQKYYEEYQKYIDLVGKEFDVQQSLIDMMKDKYQAELDYLQDIINKRKELLQVEKDAYDYQRTLQEKNKNVSNLMKQLEASKGDDSEAGKLRLQQLQVNLDEAQKDLQDTEYNQWISDQQAMLDNLYNEYKDFIDYHMNETDALLQEAIDYLKDPATKTDFLNTWDTYMSKYDFKPESDLKSVLDKLSERGDIVSAINGVANSITGYYNEQQADTIAAQEVIDKINGLGEFGSDGWFTRLSEVNTMYNGLTDTQKAKVDSASVATLNSANSQEQQWNAQQIANAEKTKKDQEEATKKAQEERNKKAQEEADKFKKREDVKDWIVANKGNANYWEVRKYEDLSDTQKIIASIYQNTSIKEGKHNKRYMSATGMNQLSQKLDSLGVTDGTLYDKLRKIGYSQGGIVDHLQKVPGMNGDDGWVTLKRGEAVLTPEQTKQFQTLAKNLDVLNPAVDILSNIQKPNFDLVPSHNITQSVGDIHINMEFPNVTNYEDFRRKMQSDPKIEKMFKSIIWDKGDLSKYKISM